MDNKELFSDQVIGARLVYHFEVRETGQGELYLKISEHKLEGNTHKRYQILVLEEEIEDFTKVFNKAVAKIKGLKTPSEQPKKKKSPLKKTKPAQPWTEEEDAKLMLLHQEGKSTEELAQVFGRQKRAITSRIRKLKAD